VKVDDDCFFVAIERVGRVNCFSEVEMDIKEEGS
jgi:hypothetical protein